MFQVKRQFKTWDQVKQALMEYCESEKCKLSIASSTPAKPKNDLLYDKVKYVCSLGKPSKTKGAGIRNKRSQKVGCPFFFELEATTDKKALVVKTCFNKHSSLCKQRRDPENAFSEHEESNGSDDVNEQNANDDTKDTLKELGDFISSSTEKSKKVKAVKDLLGYWKDGKNVAFIVDASESLQNITPLDISVVNSSAASQELHNSNDDSLIESHLKDLLEPAPKKLRGRPPKNKKK